MKNWKEEKFHYKLQNRNEIIIGNYRNESFMKKKNIEKQSIIRLIGS